jgi:Spy/CpxP family protein refolding chaperone
MKRLNALALAGLLALPFAGSVQAQQPVDHPRPHAPAELRRHRGPDMANRLISMRSELNLNDAQVARITEIQSSYRQKNAPLMARLRGARPDSGFGRRHPGFNRDSVRAMTPDQRKEMRDTMRARHEDYLKAHPEVREAGKELRANMQSMRKDIDSVLSSEQRAQLKERFQQQREQRQHPTRS